ncbi:MAG: hypothetical protein LKF71_06225 [Oscillospiraceae bacterium]|jgi:hypothetical protein|nr:hypothetical protein [Oscillospiraceae bacterium]
MKQTILTRNTDKTCLEENADMLEDLEDNGGYEITTFDLELSDAEKVDLLEMLVFHSSCQAA